MKQITKEFVMQPREDHEVELVFQSDCACKQGSNYVAWNPSTLIESGTPICPECGTDYDYCFTQVKHDTSRE